MGSGGNDDDRSLVAMTAQIVAAYVRNHSLSAGDLSALIQHIHTALRNTAQPTLHTVNNAHAPAVDVKQSVENEFIICLEDGERFKSLKRHLRIRHNLTPQQYRDKWGLPANYPMVAPHYAKKRSNLAKASGLGQKRPRKSRTRPH